MIQETRDALLFAKRTHLDAIEDIDKAIARLDELDGMALKPRQNAHQLVQTYMSKLGTTQTPTGAHNDLRSAGHDVTIDAVTQAMYRMERKGILSKGGHGHYVWNGAPNK